MLARQPFSFYSPHNTEDNVTRSCKMPSSVGRRWIDVLPLENERLTNRVAKAEEQTERINESHLRHRIRQIC
ncbi:hypothetical protein TcWFU_008013 [Taenia crassiceps]|uniref:Uncharacterized protein n=1 Tax=Taenia crassiceps TaxID=6207 RepID=A0ABR4QI42_9CEST